MLLAIDAGNTDIHIGVIKNNEIISQFRYKTFLSEVTSDQLGIFFITALRENGINPKKIKACAISSVVPHINHSVGSSIIKYLDIKPFFISYNSILGFDMSRVAAKEVGSDRMAGCAGALAKFSDKNILMIDLGTATTLDIVTKERVYLSGAILTGVKTTLNALSSNASLLSSINITQPKVAIGYDTDTNILSGVYYGQLGAIKEIKNRMISEFGSDDITTVATGGFSSLFKDENIFDTINQDLILKGINEIYLMNKDSI